MSAQPPGNTTPEPPRTGARQAQAADETLLATNSVDPIAHARHSNAGKPRVPSPEPDYLRGVYPVGKVARIPFEGLDEPLTPAAQPYIIDSTFRDGQQASPPYRVETVVRLYTLLHRLGGGSGLIRGCEFFLYTERDRRAVEACRALGYAFPKPLAWIRAHPDDLALAQAMDFDEACLLLSVSDYHIHRKLGLDRARYTAQTLALAEAALAAGMTPRFHLEDVTRADLGFCLELTRALEALCASAGVAAVFRLCDTLGLAVPYPGAALPRSTARLVSAFIHEGGVPGARLEFHGHNDLHKALANTVTAWLAGAAGASGTLLGFGERTGNAPVEALAVEHVSLTGRDDDVDLTAAPEIARVFEEELGLAAPANYPLVGRDATATAAGIHVHGAARDPEVYAAFDFARLLNRPTKVFLTDRSGLSGVAYWVNERFDLQGEAAVDKRDPGVAAMHKEVLAAYGEGGRERLNDEELTAMARRHIPAARRNDAKET